MISLTEQEYHNHVNNYDGICAECEEIHDGGVEPDAEEYECDCCGAAAVMGIENALISGLIDIK
jgi:hypothetical protein